MAGDREMLFDPGAGANEVAPWVVRYEAAVGERIRAVRRSLGLTQRALAEHLGISLGALDRVETGAADPAPHLASLAELSGKPLEWFTDGRDPPRASEPDEARAATERVRETRRRLEDRRRQLVERERERTAETPPALTARAAELDRRERELEERRVDVEVRAAKADAALAEVARRRVQLELLAASVASERDRVEAARAEFAEREARRAREVQRLRERLQETIRQGTATRESVASFSRGTRRRA